MPARERHLNSLAQNAEIPSATENDYKAAKKVHNVLSGADGLVLMLPRSAFVLVDDSVSDGRHRSRKALQQFVLHGVAAVGGFGVELLGRRHVLKLGVENGVPEHAPRGEGGEDKARERHEERKSDGEQRGARIGEWLHGPRVGAASENEVAEQQFAREMLRVCKHLRGGEYGKDEPERGRLEQVEESARLGKEPDEPPRDEAQHPRPHTEAQVGVEAEYPRHFFDTPHVPLGLDPPIGERGDRVVEDEGPDGDDGVGGEIGVRERLERRVHVLTRVVRVPKVDLVREAERERVVALARLDLLVRLDESAVVRAVNLKGLHQQVARFQVSVRVDRRVVQRVPPVGRTTKLSLELVGDRDHDLIRVDLFVLDQLRKNLADRVVLVGALARDLARLERVHRLQDAAERAVRESVKRAELGVGVGVARLLRDHQQRVRRERLVHQGAHRLRQHRQRLLVLGDDDNVQEPGSVRRERHAVQPAPQLRERHDVRGDGGGDGCGGADGEGGEGSRGSEHEPERCFRFCHHLGGGDGDHGPQRDEDQVANKGVACALRRESTRSARKACVEQPLRPRTRGRVQTVVRATVATAVATSTAFEGGGIVRAKGEEGLKVRRRCEAARVVIVDDARVDTEWRGCKELRALLVQPWRLLVGAGSRRKKPLQPKRFEQRRQKLARQRRAEESGDAHADQELREEEERVENRHSDDWQKKRSNERVAPKEAKLVQQVRVERVAPKVSEPGAVARHQRQQHRERLHQLDRCLGEAARAVTVISEANTAVGHTQRFRIVKLAPGRTLIRAVAVWQLAEQSGELRRGEDDEQPDEPCGDAR
eukprot:2698574-Pleurochrysis_carterae.AAC.1